jgi:hypothetical protein
MKSIKYSLLVLVFMALFSPKLQSFDGKLAGIAVGSILSMSVLNDI